MLVTGLILGIVVNPYWPNNLSYYYQIIIQISIINLGSKFAVGNEWYGIGFMKLVSYAPHLFMVAFISFVLSSFNLKKISRQTWFTFLLTFAFMILSIKSRRYAEYYTPFALLFTASAITDLPAV